MAEERKGTEYVILVADVADEERGIEALHRWDLLKGNDSAPIKVRAPNDVAAIKEAEKLLGTKFDHGAVAIPSRSWRPRVPKDEMVPRRLWS